MSTPQHDEALHPREATGKFATKPVSEVAGGLDALAPAPAEPEQHWVYLERDHGPDLAVGPYESEDAATAAMDDSALIDGFAAEDALDIYVTSADDLSGDLDDIERWIVNPHDPDQLGASPDDDDLDFARETIPNGTEQEVLTLAGERARVRAWEADRESREARAERERLLADQAPTPCACGTDLSPGLNEADRASIVESCRKGEIHRR